MRRSLFAAAAVVLALAAGAFVLLRPRSTTLSDPTECRTGLQTTTSCRGESRSFQECLYSFRAEGTPRPDVCRAFLSAPKTALPDAGASCDELSPTGWAAVPCADFALGGGFVCFTCETTEPEAHRTLVQAFAPSCDRAIVLKGCNVDLRKQPP